MEKLFVWAFIAIVEIDDCGIIKATSEEEARNKIKEKWNECNIKDSDLIVREIKEDTKFFSIYDDIWEDVEN